MIDTPFSRRTAQRLSPYLACALTLLLSACGGGLACSDETPSCCYNQLFGCGTFDLPFGCDCSSYGLSVPRPTPPESQRNVAHEPLMTLDGDWGGTLRRTASSCDLVLPNITGGMTVKSKRRNVTVYVPGYGILRGKKTGTLRLAVSGQYRHVDMLAGCAVELGADMQGSRRKATALTRAKLVYKCEDVVVCKATYLGKMFPGK